MDGTGTKKDNKKAFELFLKSEQNKCLDTLNTKEKELFECDLKRAIANDSKAQNYVGFCYERGKRVHKNETKAFGWYLKSAENGYARAQSNLGIYYQDGRVINK